MFAQKFFVDARLVIEAVEISLRNEFNEILIALLVLAKNDEVVRPAGSRITVLVIRLRDVHFAADDRLHAGFLRGFIEAHRPEKIPMIRDRHGGHLEFCGLLDERVVAAGAVKQTEAGVEMEMNEIRHDT